jgi:extradiol dioxygenase family protein
MNAIRPFHLAIPVYNLDACRKFYRVVLECNEGRSSTQWADFNFFGHQLVLHLKPKSEEQILRNSVDGKDVPIPHFGVVLSWEDFNTFANLLKSKNVDFIIEPHVRFEGQVGEQATMFFNDPSGNALEFKAFKDLNQLFRK